MNETPYLVDGPIVCRVLIEKKICKGGLTRGGGILFQAARGTLSTLFQVVEFKQHAAP